MSAIDPVTFLRRTPPFDALPDVLFEAAARTVDVAYHPAGTRLARRGGEPLRHLYVIRKGAVRIERDGQALHVAEEGETFGYTSLVSGAATLDVVVEEDLVAYRLPAETFQVLLGDGRFAGHFALGLAARLRASLEHSPVATARTADLTLRVEQLVRRPPVWVAGETTVGEAARVMRDERVSSVLVRSDPPAMLTVRDFRNRVLADDLGPETPVARVAAGPLRTLGAATPLYEAWRTLLDDPVQHLVIERDGEIVGVVTSSDLLRHSAQGPVAALRRVERLPDRASLPGYAATVAEMAGALVAGRLDVTVIGRFVAHLNDALLRRILRWAQEDLGAPPAPFAWLAFGSEGRMEQTLLTDQDNALVYADEGAGAAAWYQALAERVNGDLEAAGFPRCAGGYMATRWKGTLSDWMRRFAGWIDSPQPQALLESSIFFDYRAVEGGLGLAPLEAVVAESVRKPAFLRFLAKSAMTFRPPSSLLLGVRGESSEVDVKLDAISPIVFLARCYGLEAGTPARNTLDRLRAAADAGLLDAETAEETAEAYRFLLGLRLRRQLEAIGRAERPTNRLVISELSAVERSRFKDALRAIRAFQDRGAFHFKTEF